MLLFIQSAFVLQQYFRAFGYFGIVGDFGLLRVRSVFGFLWGVRPIRLCILV